MSEKVSVIVSVHNVAPFVAKCIESIGNQEYQNLEIIMIDDGSMDNSGEICDVFATNGAALWNRKTITEILFFRQFF